MRFNKILIFFLTWMLLTPLPNLYAQFFATAFPVFNFGTNVFNDMPYSRTNYLRYLDDPRFLQLGIDIDWRGLQAYMRLELFQNPAIFQSGLAYSNLPLPIGYQSFTAGFNANFPSEGWLGYINDYVDISVGRRKLATGPGKYNLSLSEQAPALDAYWINIHPMTNYKVRLYGILSGAMSGHEAGRRFLTENQRYWDPTAAGGVGAWVDTYDPTTATFPQVDRYNSPFKGYFFHKIGVEGDWWRVGLSESIMVYGGAPTLDINGPLTLWHNSYIVNGNALLGVTFEFLLAQQVRVYGEWAMDDLMLGEFDNAKPTSMSFMLGADWQIFGTDTPYKGEIYRDSSRTMREQQFTKTDGLIIGIEAVYTSRFMYGRPGDDPFGKFSFFTSPQYGVNHWPLVEYYLGFPYGPQSMLIEFRGTYSSGDWYVEGSLGYLLEGQKGSGIFDIDAPGSAIDPDTIPLGASALNPFAFDGPFAHSLIFQATMYYYLRSWVQLYVGTYHQIRMDDLKKSVSAVSTGVAFHFATDILLRDSNRKQPEV
ncbi:MAG: hypothetical protein ACRCVN_03580 [Spirochaetia bacterium]